MEDATKLKKDMMSFDRKKQYAAAYQLRYCPGDGEAIFLLFNASYEASDREFVEIAIQSLSVLAPRKTLETFTKTTFNRNSEKRRIAYRNMGYLNIPDAIEAVLKGLTDPDKEVRKEAITAAGKLGNKETISKLEPLASEYEPEETRKAALAAIQSIQERQIRTTPAYRANTAKAPVSRPPGNWKPKGNIPSLYTPKGF